MGGGFICFKFELRLCDFPISVTVLVGEHVVDDAIGVEAGSQAAFALVHLPHDVVSELWKQIRGQRGSNEDKQTNSVLEILQ